MSDAPAGIPRELVEAFAAHLVRGRRAAYLLVDAAGRVTEAWGELAWHGIDPRPVGKAAEAVSTALAGTLAASASQHLPRLELVDGRASELFLERSDGRTLCLFVDATEALERERLYQQRGHELALLLRAVGAAVYRRVAPGRFRLAGERPSWLDAFGAEALADEVELARVFPFLEAFLSEAEDVWGRRGAPRSSGTWSEETPAGAELDLEALAVAVEGDGAFLVLSSVGERVAESRRLLQRAHEAGLGHERLRREIDLKEVLLHCIVHDLKGPLSGMVGSMSLLRKRDLAPARVAELLELGLEQARAQEAMMRTILEAFSAEIADLDAFDTDPAQAPDLLAALRAVRERYEPAFLFADVRLVLELDERLGHGLAVVGRRDRLERVLSNLLENALRHAPPHSRVTVSVAPLAKGQAGESGEEGVTVAVSDEGPGVPAELRPRLFRAPLTDRRATTGVAGLGLYFCRRVLETWGGGITHEALEPHGACFRLRLVRARKG